MVKFINVAKESSYYQKKGVVPIVSIGHSKDFFNNSNFSKFLSYLVENEKDKIIPYTFKDLFSETKN